MRKFIIIAFVLSAIGVITVATHPAVSHQMQGKPPGEEGTGSTFAHIGL
jgi:hypothetical protein